MHYRNLTLKLHRLDSALGRCEKNVIPENTVRIFQLCLELVKFCYENIELERPFDFFFLLVEKVLGSLRGILSVSILKKCSDVICS